MNSMLRTELFARAAFAFITALACALPVNSSAQKTGTGAVELIVPFGPGGGADTLGRATAKQLSAILAEPIQVINVPGATGRQGIGKLIAAPADGRTLAVLTADTFTLQAYSNPRWKLSDVIPLGIMMKQRTMGSRISWMTLASGRCSGLSTWSISPLVFTTS